MSIPAVLYDHVPIDDLDGEEGWTFYVSSMVHRTSAPQEDDNTNSDRFEQSRFTDNKQGNSESSDGMDIDKLESEIHNETTDDIEIDDPPMETIFEDIDFDYVLIPIPPPILPDSDNTDESVATTSPTSKLSIRKRIVKRGKAIFKSVKKSVNENCVAKCLSEYASGSRALLGPLQFYVRDILSSPIHSSYDWVSETIIDGSGNRLILPGSCISWDSDSSTENQGALIVPKGCENGLKCEDKASSGLWSSNTIMVSAHDLLAIKQDQQRQLGSSDDPQPFSLFEAIEEEGKGKPKSSRYYYRDGDYSMKDSAIVEATTHTVVQQWARALQKLAERKAKIWHCISRSYLRRSIQNAKSTFIHSQHYLMQYYKARNRQRYRSLAILANNDVQDESQSTEQNEYRGMNASQMITNQSFRNQTTSDEIIDGCDFAVRGSECTCLIEMATPVCKSRNGYRIP